MSPAAGAKYRLTANLFAIPFGISGLAQAWGAAHLLSLVPTWPRDALWSLAGAVWLGLVIGCTAQLRNSRTLAGEIADQTYGPFVALAVIVLMLFGGPSRSTGCRSAARSSSPGSSSPCWPVHG